MFKVDLSPPDKRPFDQGQEAAIIRAAPISGNPYPVGTADHAEWKAGFEAGSEVIQQPGT